MSMTYATRTAAGLMLAAAALGAAWSAPPALSKAKEMKAPDFKLEDLAGKPVKLSDFKGKVVLLNFWATWCAPCRKEIPDLVKLYDGLSKKGLVVVGVSLDDEPREAVPGFLADFQKETGVVVSYPMLVGDADVAEAYGGIYGIPTTFLIDRKGMIQKRFIGPPGRTSEQIEAAFKEAVTKLL